jgi:hypothetical protein
MTPRCGRPGCGFACGPGYAVGVQSLYWLIETSYWAALSVWLGLTLSTLLRMPGLFRTMSEQDPTLPGVLSVNLDAQHATLLALRLIEDDLWLITRLGMVCAGVLVIGTTAHMVLTTETASMMIRSVIRAVAILAAVALALIVWFVAAPSSRSARLQYIAAADDTETALPARQRLETAHRRQVAAVFALAMALLAAVVFSVPGAISRLTLN